jgi:F-type H+-transporting ATPase subunit b
MLEIPPHVSYYFQIVFFLIFAAILRAVIWKPTQKLLADRESRTSGAQREALEMRAEATALEQQLATALEEARQAGGDAGEKVRREAEAEERRLLEAAHAEAVQTLAQTRERLQRETAAARSTLKEQSGALAHLAAERILGRPVNA